METLTTILDSIDTEHQSVTINTHAEELYLYDSHNNIGILTDTNRLVHYYEVAALFIGAEPVWRQSVYEAVRHGVLNVVFDTYVKAVGNKTHYFIHDCNDQFAIRDDGTMIPLENIELVLGYNQNTGKDETLWQRTSTGTR